MPYGPISKIVIKRPDGRTEIIGRGGHIDLRMATQTFAKHGEVVTVRHEMNPRPGKGIPHVVAIHNAPPARKQLR